MDLKARLRIVNWRNFVRAMVDERRMRNRFGRSIDWGFVNVLTPYAREMRAAPTRSEALLWNALRKAQLGCRFRRQVVLGRYIVDFFAPKVGLVVEIDGDHHDPDVDRRRDELLIEKGFYVLRLSTSSVENDFTNSVRKIREAIQSKSERPLTE